MKRQVRIIGAMFMAVMVCLPAAGCSDASSTVRSSSHTTTTRPAASTTARPTQSQPQPAPQPQPVTYTVQRGDNLSRIARQYGTTVQELVSVNHISNPNIILVGQVLTIPVSGAQSSGSAGTGGSTGSTGGSASGSTTQTWATGTHVSYYGEIDHSWRENYDCLYGVDPYDYDYEDDFLSARATSRRELGYDTGG